MTLPRIQILALGGTIATAPDASGAMQMGLGADDLVGAVPLLATLADIRAETVSRVGSHSLSFDQLHALANKIMDLDVDGVVVTQGTDTLEETSFLLDLLVARDIPVIVTAAMRNPALTSADGPGNLLAAVRVACDPWVKAHAKALGVAVVMLDEVYAASDVLKIHPTRLNAFASPQTGPLAALVEERVVPLSLPVRAPIEAARKRLGAASGREQPVALLWLGLDEPGYILEAMVDHRDQLGYRGAVVGAMGGGHVPERIASLVGQLAEIIPTVVSPRAGGGPLLRQTYGGPSSEIALRKAGLIWGGRLNPLKARVLLQTCLRAGLDKAAIAEVFEAFG
ncbi:asparaginase [uncultured Reyranella sp.]|uniref:asparaginase n=1 Tax=uncultured Reyranella sp. TaxID=735512 RepID=UPI002600BFFD|nr:asparaginase [uncultured Reyranella sp.]